MGLLKKMFGTRPKIDRLRRALDQKNFVAALHLGEDLQTAGEGSEELNFLLVAAADGLAHINLEEAERQLSAAEKERALEHLQLAGEQARTEALQQQIAQRAQDVIGLTERHRPQKPQKIAAENCDTCSSAANPVGPAMELPDKEVPFELLLASYPPDVQARYQAGSDTFKQALIQIHAGRDDAALALLKQISNSEQDGLYFFELGSLYARRGQITQARSLLEQALSAEPTNLMILDGLLAVQEATPAAQDLLRSQLEKGTDSGYCHARLCEISAQQGDSPAALTLARQALAGGYASADFLVLAAGLLEKAGELEEAEGLLSALPGGGCGGGVNLHLAEFWLRRRRELGRVLDAFNGACRQEPDNPRWQLRVAQTYLARNWRKQGVELLRRVVDDPRLAEELRLEAQQLLAGG